MREIMKRFSLLASVIALCVGTASMVFSNHSKQLLSPGEDVAQITNGAFRDGLYLGRLAAKRGAEPRIATGRWATSEDRSSFTSGYRLGYSEFQTAAQHQSNTNGVQE
jgi:hypothetical protein